MSKHLNVEMGMLRTKLLALTSLVESVVAKSISSLENRDPKSAKEVIDLDHLIDSKEVEIEEDCLKVLALHQPVAIDLRYIVGALKMNNDLERIGDLAVNVAEKSIFISKATHVDAPYDYHLMGHKVIAMLKNSIHALIAMDTALARKVCHDDEEVDSIHKNMYQLVFAAIKKNPDDVETLISYLAVSRNLERIADYTTNIAEDVIYMVEGSIVRHRQEIN